MQIIRRARHIALCAGHTEFHVESPGSACGARRVRREEYQYGPRRRRRPRSRAAGGRLLWVVLLILVLIVLSVVFGGFQKGTKAGSFPHSVSVVTAAPMV